MKREVASLLKGLKALTQKAESIAERFDKRENPQSKRKPVKKAQQHSKPARKPAAGKTTKKSAEQKPAKGLSDKALGLIPSATEGMNTAQIMNQTGLNKKQVWGIVSRAKKAGKLKTGKRGIYIAS